MLFAVHEVTCEHLSLLFRVNLTMAISSALVVCSLVNFTVLRIEVNGLPVLAISEPATFISATIQVQHLALPFLLE